MESITIFPYLLQVNQLIHHAKQAWGCSVPPPEHRQALERPATFRSWVPPPQVTEQGAQSESSNV